jgi:class 3 adenylate cyclase
MDFYEMLERVLALLQRHGRLSYRALKRQFDLDDALEDLKEELLFGHPVDDEESRGLVWTGNPSPFELDAQRALDTERRFHHLALAVAGLLQRDRRLTYRSLKWTLGVDDALLDEIREELTLRRLAIDEAGKVLVWIGETQPTAPSGAFTPSQSASPEPTTVTETLTPSNGPTATLEPISKAAPQDESAETTAPTRSASEAERRQLTVMFCDLADSTRLSQQLDPEDLRGVVRAYQQTAAEVIQQYDGHIAQYLGDGLLIYFGWPVAHEDDAQRSLHAGMGIVNAITSSLNPRLQQQKGVKLTVRLGIHTGPVVVGEMGGGERHENLATGETVNIAARLEGLATPNTVLVSGVTERLVRGVFILEDLGAQELKGVAERMPVFRVLGIEAQFGDDETVSGGIPFLVGRDEEVGLLLRRWEQAKEGLGQVVLVNGEAGIGKSTLLTTVRRHAMEAGGTRMTFRCSPYHTNSALYPVIEHVQHVLQFQPSDTPETKLDKLEQVLSSYSRPLQEVVPLYAALLSVPVPDGRYPPLNLTPQQQKQQTQDALVGWMLEEAERRPTLAMWEDLH